jgi:TonB family protein
MKCINAALMLSVLFVAFSFYVQAQTFPTVTKFEVPPYPPAAIAVRAEGNVRIQAEIDSTGKVISVNPVEGHKLLVPAAREISRKWEFSSVPGTHFITLTFLFRLPKSNVKEFARLRGAYTLEFASPYYRLVSEPSHTADKSRDQ